MTDKDLQPSEAELEILQILWEIEPATVRMVHETLSRKKQVGYTTTLKQMQRMLDKRLLTREEQGKTHLYTAIARPDEIRKNLFDRLVDTAFEGSAMKLVMHALGGSETSEEEIEQLMNWLEQQKQNKDRHE